ncbi:inovirus-type Gp2 protein [Caballeronia sp. LZ033]|uniref:YagK/YfjJ domain-containing protein n=1 Tax=Caballeronia sp. LZ033 TaxID=3038566 RepID=UPI00285CD6CE|nr:inovirus-type Gp2 protein [Caballeronia sp. LZ033]MDR5814982.1 inovirus-type Gp2 protein [Caballeronia sp. LZ033]
MKEKKTWKQLVGERLGNLAAESIDLGSRIDGARDKKGSRVLLGESTKSLHTLVNLMYRVIEKKQVAFKFDKRMGKSAAVEASALANYYRQMPNMTDLYRHHENFAPLLRHFFECFMNHDIVECRFTNPNDKTADGSSEAEVFNNFLAFMYEQGVRVNIKKQIEDWQNGIDDNAARLKVYIDALFERYARLVVVRIDLEYKVACPNAKQVDAAKRALAKESMLRIERLYGRQPETGEVLETQARFDVSEVMADRDHLFENMRSKPSIFRHCVGKVWRIEWSRASGYHLHAAFIFDGSKVKKHEWLGEQIGQYWVNTITQGRGLYHNCNRDKHKHGERWGIGEIGHSDTIKRGKLMCALSYLAKRSQYVYVKPSVKCKCFGTGRMPSARSAAGRPRKAGGGGLIGASEGCRHGDNGDMQSSSWHIANSSSLRQTGQRMDLG